MSLQGWSGVQSARLGAFLIEFCATFLMTHKPEDGALEEIILPENLLPLGSVLGAGVTPLDVSMILASVFKVQHAEVALLRLEGGLLKVVFPGQRPTPRRLPIPPKAAPSPPAVPQQPNSF